MLQCPATFSKNPSFLKQFLASQGMLLFQMKAYDFPVLMSNYSKCWSGINILIYGLGWRTTFLFFNFINCCFSNNNSPNEMGKRCIIPVWSRLDSTACWWHVLHAVTDSSGPVDFMPHVWQEAHETCLFSGFIPLLFLLLWLPSAFLDTTHCREQQT